MKIGIIDYGMGNLFSVEQALKRLGVQEVIVSGEASVLEKADAFILPGVGAFQDAIERLEQSGLQQFIYTVVQQQKPLLGICLGMQLLFQSSEENGFFEGLSIFEGRIKKFDEAALRIPHMGWNEMVIAQEKNWMQRARETDQHVYFVHSYYADAVDTKDLVAYAQYGDVQVPAILQKGNVTAMQFHPEKSGKCGMGLLTGWLEEVQKEVEAV